MGVSTVTELSTGA